jgi:hypothetical protein
MLKLETLEKKMREQARIIVDCKVSGGRRTWSVVLSSPGSEKSCWIETDADLPEPPNLDFALLAALHPAMAQQTDLYLEGCASYALLANLEHYIDIWTSWRPDLYRPVGLDASEVEVAAPDVPLIKPPAVQAFSGGLDACATLVRQREGLAGRSTVDVRELMLCHGFDIPIENAAAFDRGHAKVRRQVEPLGLETRVVRTNWRKALSRAFNMEYVCVLSACLHLYAGRYPVGLFAIDDSYAMIKVYLPFGGNPVSNRHVCGLFEVRGDAGALSRCDKAALVARYPSLRDNLRCCWKEIRAGRNCGRCEKCIRTQLNFIAMGLDPGASFPEGLAPRDVKRIRPTSGPQLAYMKETCAEADARGISDERIEALRKVLALVEGRSPARRADPELGRARTRAEA